MMNKRFLLTALCRAAVCVVATLVLPVSAQGDQADPTRVDAAFAQLLAEANELDSLSELDHPAVFSRPHRVVRALRPDDGEAVARRLADKLTNHLYSDTYVRWHLMPTVHAWLADRTGGAGSVQNGPSEALPDDVIRSLRALFDDMPPEAKSRYENPYSEEGRRIGKRIGRLYAQTRVKVGVPPFEKTYSGRAALPHMSPNERRAAEKIVEEIEALQAQRKRMHDPAIEQRNERYKEMVKVSREYRCDLTYALLQTGDARSLNAVGSAIGQLIRRRQRAGFDLMQYVYKAMHDGYLRRYDDRALKSFRAQLSKIAASTRRYEAYHRGDEPMPDHVRPKMRSFGAYAAHMIDLLEDPGQARWFTPAADQPGTGAATKPVGPFDPKTLSISDIRAAIGSAIDELYTARRQGDYADRILPRETIRHDSMYWYLGRYKKGSPRYQEAIYETGNHALTVWAMLAAGESYQNPRLRRRISWVLASDTPFTYDRGMRMLMLSELSLDRWGASAKRDAKWLASAITDRGNFTGTYFGGPSTGWGDHGSGLYGVLGLWGAERMGIDLNAKKFWAPIDKHWRATQLKTPGNHAAGWAIGMPTNDELASDTRRQRAGNTYTTANASMTAGGVATLTLTERILNGSKLTKPGKDNVSKELRKGLRWLDENFDPAQSFGVDWFYTMWTVQRVGQATGRRTFNGVDWYRHVTAEMLNRQGNDGLWHDPSGNQGKLLSSGFALLYLAGALDPIAVSKIRFDGRWDNRPNDLWNFVDYASDKYEVDTAWQVVSLNQPMHELVDSPLLYLATHEPFTLSDAETDRLREYIDAGGMLVFNPEAPWGRLSGSVEALAEALFPGRSFETVAQFHPFYSLHTRLRPSVPMRMVHNGVRPLIVAFTKDIGRGLQVNDPLRQPDSFVAMSNIYLFAVATEPHRTRLDASYVAPPVRWPTNRVEVARVRYAGNDDPEPGALAQMRAVMARDHDIDLAVQTVDADGLGEHRIAFLTTTGQGALTDAQVRALRAWIDSGGTLWLDAAGGTPDAAAAANAELLRLFPNRIPTPLADDSPIITGQGLGPDAHDNRRVVYSLFAQRQMGPTHTPRLQAVMIDDRPAVIYSPEDLTAALAGVGHWGIFGYSTDSARKLVANGILDATR